MLGGGCQWVCLSGPALTLRLGLWTPTLLWEVSGSLGFWPVCGCVAA